RSSIRIARIFSGRRTCGTASRNIGCWNCSATSAASGLKTMATEDFFWRRAVVFGSAMIYWAGVLIHARRIRKHIGRSPNVTPRGTKEKLLWTGWLFVIMGWMAMPFLAGKNTPLPLLRFLSTLLHPASLALGVLLLVAGYACTLWCYAAMGDTWRMGINRKEKTSLVTRGPYRFVRHPIYLFQVVMLV